MLEFVFTIIRIIHKLMGISLQTRNEATDQVSSTSLTQLEPVRNSNDYEYSTLDTRYKFTNFLDIISFTIKKKCSSVFLTSVRAFLI